ncbi:MAG: hypothetical protein E7451_08495 [Ruminococcaceae bacterium]|nr:hypothetical protein [Oscillospiraceae bacterium]
MDKLTTLFHTVGDSLTGASWFEYVQWPFWAFLIIIAVGGVYNARFNKNSLLCRGILGALKLAVIYMVAVAGHIWAPSFMSGFSQLPFLSVSKETLTLVNPLGLLDRWNTALPQVLVRLYFLLFLINAVATFDYNGRQFPTWVLFQTLSCTAAVVIYSAISAFLIKFWPFPLSWLYNIIAILLLLVFFLMLLFKLFFLLNKKPGNHAYTVLLQFFTKQKFGSLFTVSALSWLTVLFFLVVLNLFGMGRMAFANFNTAAFLLIGAMCTVTMYIYAKFFTER